MDMMPIDNRTLAGIKVPATPIVDRAIEDAVRSWLFAARIGQLQSIEHDAEVVAVGTLLHNLTLNEGFAGPRRFEVEGADPRRVLADAHARFFGTVLGRQSLMPGLNARIGPSTRHRDLKDRNYVGAFYIGLGDQFDDDRRLVRDAALPSGPAREARHNW
jgi:hypothetical protein